MKRIFTHIKPHQRSTTTTSPFCKSWNSPTTPTSPLFTTTIQQQQQQTANKHFVIIQWPNNEVSLKLDNRKTAQEHDEFFHDISQYAESQIQRLHGLKPKPKKSSPLEYNHQPSRQLDALLSHKTTSHTAPCTYSVQLNSVTMIDPTYFKQQNSEELQQQQQQEKQADVKQQVTTMAVEEHTLSLKKKRVSRKSLVATTTATSSKKVQQAQQQTQQSLQTQDKNGDEMFVMQAFQSELKQRYQAALKQQAEEEEQQLLQKSSEVTASSEQQKKKQQQKKKTAATTTVEHEEDDDDDDLSKEQQALTTEEATTAATVEQA